MRKRVLVVGPSKKTRGGITSVISAYEDTELWDKWSIIWIETQIDKGFLLKMYFFITSFSQFLFYLPSSSIIHIHLSEPPSAFRKCFYFLPAFILKKKIITHFHSFSPESTINSKYSKLYYYLFKNSDLTIVLSEYWMTEVAKSFGSDIKTHVLYNPCITINNKNIYTTTKESNYILFAGTLNQRKGYKDLIDAFASISKLFPNWSIFFAGNGEIEEGLQKVEYYSLKEQVKFLGWVKDNDKDNVFRNASIFCLPSYAEGFPMSVLDAMAYSLPIVATPVGGIPDVFTNRVSALFFEPGNIVELTECLKDIISDETLRLKLANESLKLANTKFDIISIIKELDNIYLKLSK